MENKTFNEIWIRRSLIFNIALGDLKLRYRNSVLGFFWSFLEPLLIMTVLYFVFSNLFKADIENFPLYILLGLIMWNMFSRGTTMGLDSIITKAGLVGQTYLPREVVVISAVLTSFLMMLLEIIVFFFFMVAFQVIPTVTLVMLPPMIIIVFLMTLGMSFALSVLNVYYRDLRSIWGVILTAGFFATPIIYSLEMISDEIRSIISLNPLVPLLEISRGATIYNYWPGDFEITYLLTTTFVVLVLGYAVFKRLDKKIVEEL